MSQYATFEHVPNPGFVRRLKSRILAHPGPVSELTRMYCEEAVYITNYAHSHEVWVAFEDRKAQLREPARAREAAKARKDSEEAAEAALKAQVEEAGAKARARKAAMYEEMCRVRDQIRARNARAAEEVAAKARAAEEASRNLEELLVLQELARRRALSGFLLGILKALVPGAFWV